MRGQKINISGAPSKKKFGDKTYKLYGTYKTKREADANATEQRSNIWKLARVIPYTWSKVYSGKREQGYAVYVRNKRTG